MSPVAALLGDSLDFAGRYPPARLSPEATVAEYARLLRKAPWFAGRLVWPAEDLDRLSDLAEGHAPTARLPETQGAWAVSAVTRAAASEDFRFDLESIGEFNERHSMEGGAAMRIDSLECRVESLADCESVVESTPEDVFPYLEIAWQKDPRGLIAALAGAGAGAKLRTGGLDAASHPSADAVAQFVVACARADVPFKATAGLHRAMRHQDDSIGCAQHGFMNLFAAAALVQANAIDETRVARLLCVTNPSEIVLSRDGIAWSGQRANQAAIRSARQDLLHSFGSCSWEEPIADLTALRLLDGEVVA